MTLEQWSDAVLRLIGYLVSWPVVTLMVVCVFRRRINAALTALAERVRRASLGPVSVEFDDVKLGALKDTTRQAVKDFGSDPALADFLEEQISKLNEHGSVSGDSALSGHRILWADDNIEHNLFEMNYLQRSGAEITPVTTTAEALSALDADRFDLVISDVHRIEDGIENPQAGLTLLSEMRASKRSVPLVFYTANATLLRSNPDVANYGAVVTDTANELLREVTRMLGRRGKNGRRQVTSTP